MPHRGGGSMQARLVELTDEHHRERSTGRTDQHEQPEPQSPVSQCRSCSGPIECPRRTGLAAIELIHWLLLVYRFREDGRFSALLLGSNSIDLAMSKIIFWKSGP